MVHWYFPQQHRQCRCFRYTAKIIVYRHWFICPVQPVVMDRKLLTNFFLVCNLHISEKFSGHRLSCCLWNPCPSTMLFGEGLGLGLELFYKPRTIIHVGVRIAQWWEHSLPIIVAWFKYVGWVCCLFSPLLREFFLRFSPLLKNQHFQIPIRLGMVDEEPLCGCSTSKSLRSEKKCVLFECQCIQHGNTNWGHYFYVSSFWRRARHFT